MSFYISHRYGGDERDPPLEALEALLDEVDEDPSDVEHVGVSVVHESGWCASVYAGWTVVCEDLEDLSVAPRHLEVGPDRERVLSLMRAIARGELELLEQQP